MQKPFLAGRQEFATLYGVKPTQVTQWIARGVLNYDSAVILSGSPYWLMSFARGFGQMTPRPKELDTLAVQRIVAEQEPGVWATSLEEVPPMVGLQEVTQLFGLSSQQNLSAVVRQGRFASADYQLSGSPLWLLDTVIKAVPEIREKSRTLTWTVDPQVEAALRQRRYTGPGSKIVPRGLAARAV
ncbi:hypothetical protein BX257_4038 [Streptomyces sp. 3212.3]|uniref:hypothetical protein n=1 Tax=Streptomyces sp. 3212.3 TaxID=1938846 RepID=UPI000E224AEC|nr:hypothetical protein [Streptomyces sp. 3212.3]REE61459.1 hypothetical protein BX257_4038 [Streptomyces sp. 3212.3]